jgi:hypothetical protein
MTAAPADQTPTASDATAPARQPSPPVPEVAAAGPVPRVTVSPVRPLAAAGLAWAVFFVSLVVVYLVAFNRHARACEAAAGWGLAISLAAALLEGAFTAARPPAPDGGPALSRALIRVAGAALVAASATVIWIAINLTLASDTAGAWALTVVALAAVAAAPLYRLAAPAVAVVPPVIDEPVADERVAGELLIEELVDEELLTEEPATEELLTEEPATEAPVTDELVTDELVTDEPVIDELVIEKPVAEEPVTPRPYRGLLSPDWADRLGSAPPPVAIDARFWATVHAALGKRQNEIGGVALTVRVQGTLILLGAVLPDQLKANASFCEFPAEEVNRVRTAINAAAGNLGIDPTEVTISWVHTHPRIGPFLSGTDVNTARDWRAFDPDFTPIVMDPLASPDRLDRQIGVFDAHSKPIKPVKVIDGLADDAALARLKEELADVYRRAGARRAMILIPGTDR